MFYQAPQLRNFPENYLRRIGFTKTFWKFSNSFSSCEISNGVGMSHRLINNDNNSFGVVNDRYVNKN